MTDDSISETRGGIELTLFCHGLGDCHLLGLPGRDSKKVWMLIDCGLHGSTQNPSMKLSLVDAALREQLDKDRLSVVALTHEHWDHNSGFHPSRGIFTQGKPAHIDQLWLGWTEDPQDPMGSQLDKYKRQALAALTASERRISQTGKSSLIGAAWRAMLGFYGENSISKGSAYSDSPAFALKGDVTRAARDGAISIAAERPRYLQPGDVAPIPGVDAVRCYVLGPPRDHKLLGCLDSVADTFSAAPAHPPLLTALSNAIDLTAGKIGLDDDEASPFDASEGMSLSKARDQVRFLQRHYTNEPERTIDDDWVMGATDLALQLDAKTNNTSLVLAFEIIATGHVLLFAADAQVGNWRSWSDVKFPSGPGRPATTGADLLARTVFYKVGHHGSRNATLKEGLEQMTSLEIAFNPTDEAMAKKVGWSDIPAGKLNAELERRTKGRLIQSDASWLHDAKQSIPITIGGALTKISRGAGPSLKMTIV